MYTTVVTQLSRFNTDAILLHNLPSVIKLDNLPNNVFYNIFPPLVQDPV